MLCHHSIVPTVNLRTFQHRFYASQSTSLTRLENHQLIQFYDFRLTLIFTIKWINSSDIWCAPITTPNRFVIKRTHTHTQVLSVRRLHKVEVMLGLFQLCSAFVWWFPSPAHENSFLIHHLESIAGFPGLCRHRSLSASLGLDRYRKFCLHADDPAWFPSTKHVQIVFIFLFFPTCFNQQIILAYRKYKKTSPTTMKSLSKLPLIYRKGGSKGSTSKRHNSMERNDKCTKLVGRFINIMMLSKVQHVNSAEKIDVHRPMLRKVAQISFFFFFSFLKKVQRPFLRLSLSTPSIYDASWLLGYFAIKFPLPLRRS